MQSNVEKIQMSDSFILGIILTVVGGFLDAYTYLLRGKVFANAQTGNIVLLGINIAEGNFKKALYYLLPILAFILGVVFTESIKKNFKASETIHWRQIIIVIEIVLLFFIGFLPIQVMDSVANITIAFVCSVQVSSFKTLRGASYATTMCTGNLRLATEQFYTFIYKKDREAGGKSARYYLVILFFTIGATMGAILSKVWKEKSVWACCFMLAIVFAIMFKSSDESMV